MFKWLRRPSLQDIKEKALYETEVTILHEEVELDQARARVGHHEARVYALRQRQRRLKIDLADLSDLETRLMAEFRNPFGATTGRMPAEPPQFKEFPKDLDTDDITATFQGRTGVFNKGVGE